MTTNPAVPRIDYRGDRSPRNRFGKSKQWLDLENSVPGRESACSEVKHSLGSGYLNTLWAIVRSSV